MKNYNGNEMIYNKTLNDYEKLCNYCIMYIVLFVIAFLIIISIGNTFIYCHWIQMEDVFKQQFIKHINSKYQTN